MAMGMDIVQKYIDSALKSEVIEESFANYVNYPEESLKSSINNSQQIKRIILSINASQEPDKIIKHYVNLTAQVKSENKSTILFEMLENLIKQNSALGKSVCEAILNCEKLEYHNQTFWMKSFLFISTVIPNIEYKGVRDILKMMLDKIYSFPERFDIEIIPQLDALYKTFAMILDRDACLLPAYLGLDELQKKITQGKAPIWKFAELFYQFIESFKPTAQIVSITNRSELLPVVGYSSTLGYHSWRLDPVSAKFQVKGLLPYKNKLKEPQLYQLRYLVEQPYSRDMLGTILSLNSKPKHRCTVLEEQLVDAIVLAMERSNPDLESIENFDAETNEHLFHWQHLSCNLLYFVLFHHATFAHIVDDLYNKLLAKNLKRGREHLMWVLLQYISGSIQREKIPMNEFLNVIKLFDLLYSGREAIPVPRIDKPACTHIMAAATILFHLFKKIEMEFLQKNETDPSHSAKPPAPKVPPALRLHYEYLYNMYYKDLNELTGSINIDFRAALLCNAYSTNNEKFLQGRISPLSLIINAFHNPQRSNVNTLPSMALPMSLLDSLTVHSKMSIIHSIVSQIVKMAQGSQGTQKLHLTPAMVETYSRLLVYTEIETFGVKNFINSILGAPTVGNWNQAWPIYHVLLEMFTYRLYHVPLAYKLQLLIHLHNLSSVVYQQNHVQLSLTMEATELKLILGLSSNDVISITNYTSRSPNDAKGAKQMISNESEELNKIFVLVLARSVHITSSEALSSSWIEEILQDIKQVTPLSWSTFSLNHFPPSIKEFFQTNMPPKENNAQLKPAVEEEYRKWKAITNENSLVTHFSQPNAPPLFICLLWKMVLKKELLLEKEYLNPIVYKILDSIRIKALSAHLRTFADYLVYECANSHSQEFTKYMDALSDLIWKFHIITLDRLTLIMCLRSFEGKEATVCSFIIQNLLLQKNLFKTRLLYFIHNYSPEHWRQNPDWYENHLNFHKRFPEKYYSDCLIGINQSSSQSQPLPTYFSNVCLRLIYVFDLLIHRYLELPATHIEAAGALTLLNEFGCIYKFHEKPITYLYNTLNYYNAILQERPAMKYKLVGSITGAFKDIKPANWCFSESFNQYLKGQTEEGWKPNLSYYIKLIGRLVDALQNKSVFPHTDWRFNEFQNVKAHALYCTSVELMALPETPQIVGGNLLDIILVGHVWLDRDAIVHWMNAIGLVLTALPTSYYNVLNAKIMEYLQSPLLTQASYLQNVLQLIDFCDNHQRMYESQLSYLVALTHAVWHHSNTGQISSLPVFLREEIKPAIRTENQYLFICSLIGPFLPRIERTRTMMDVTIELYEILEKVDQLCDIQHLDTICDLLYHIKYMFTGDAVKKEIERCIRNFKPKLQFRLRFITHLNIAEAKT